jgi:hypothetical protein
LLLSEVEWANLNFFATVECCLCCEEDTAMKTFSLSVCLLIIVTTSAAAQNNTPNFGLPALHTIRTVTLAPPYSCRSPEEVKKGYDSTALFLSAYSKQRNNPDLLFNGACKADNYFQPGTTFS